MKTTQRSSILFATVAISTVCLGLLQAQLPREASFFIIYLVPLAVGSYLLSLRLSLILVLVTLLTWTMSDYFSNPKYSTNSILLWNTGARGFAFLAFSGLIQYFRSQVNYYKTLADRSKDLAQRGVATGETHLICDTCSRLASKHDHWVSPLEFIIEKLHPTLHSCICPHCLNKAKLSPDNSVSQPFSTVHQQILPSPNQKAEDPKKEPPPSE